MTVPEGMPPSKSPSSPIMPLSIRTTPDFFGLEAGAMPSFKCCFAAGFFWLKEGGVGGVGSCFAMVFPFARKIYIEEPSYL
jgi:hypothetical protein